VSKERSAACSVRLTAEGRERTLRADSLPAATRSIHDIGGIVKVSGCCVVAVSKFNSIKHPARMNLGLR